VILELLQFRPGIQNDVLHNIAIRNLSYAQTPNPLSCPNIPSPITYAANTKLPSPFLSVVGSRVTTKDQWACRKMEIRQILQRYEHGPMPPAPSSVAATFAPNTLKITVSDGGKTVSFSVPIKYPTSGKEPYLAIMAYHGGSIPIPATVATITHGNLTLVLAMDAGKGLFTICTATLTWQADLLPMPWRSPPRQTATQSESALLAVREMEKVLWLLGRSTTVSL
jgi:Glucuronyl esterase, fungi